MKEVKTSKAPAAIGPYSQGIITGNLLFASGQVPLDPKTGSVVEGGIKEQAHRVFQNIRAIMEAAGTSMDNVVKTDVFIKDMNDFAAVNEVYAEYFTKPYPARSCVEVARLPKDVLIEVETIAEL